MTADDLKRLLAERAKEIVAAAVNRWPPMDSLDEIHVGMGIDAVLEQVFRHLASIEADHRAKVEVLEAKINVLEVELAEKSTPHVRYEAGRAPAWGAAAPFDPE